MKTERILIVVLALTLLFILTVPLSQAQFLGGGSLSAPSANRPAGMGSYVPIQGRLTGPSGNALNGSYSMTFSLYEAASGGPALCSDPLGAVSVTNGLFSVSMYCSAANFDGRALWLGISVGVDPEMTPRREIRAVPYAMSLRPGAVISDTIGGNPLLHVENWGSGGRGIRSYAMDSASTNYGIVGASRSASGYGGYLYNTGGGTGLLAESDTGVALKAGGTGMIASTANAYIFVPGHALVKSTGDAVNWTTQANGAVNVTSGGGAPIDKYVFLPITLPGVLYGQAVTIESITLYYKCENAANYITQTTLNKQTGADSMETVFSESTNRASTTATSYTLTLVPPPPYYNVLSSSEGILSLLLILHFGNDADFIQLGGVRVKLSHQ